MKISKRLVYRTSVGQFVLAAIADTDTTGEVRPEEIGNLVVLAVNTGTDDQSETTFRVRSVSKRLGVVRAPTHEGATEAMSVVHAITYYADLERV